MGIGDDEMKNLKEAAERSKKGRTPIYYNYQEEAIYFERGPGRFYVTDLIRENTEEEIERTIRWWMSL